MGSRHSLTHAEGATAAAHQYTSSARVVFVFVALCVGIVAPAGCRDKELPPYGEAVFEIDTNAAVPSIANRIRIDLFNDDGEWIESRDIARSDPRDWPVSFGTYSSDESKPKTRVLVRLRAYPDGFIRDYIGERNDPITFVEPWTATDASAMCGSSALKPLVQGEEITLRRGPTPITTTPNCASSSPTKSPTPQSGSVAAQIVVKDAGDYRIGVIDAQPQRGTLRVVPLDWTITLRRTCEDPNTEIACSSEANTPLDLHLDPGTYVIVTGGNNALFQPADLTLRWTRVADWDTPRKIPETAARKTALDLRSDPQATPRTEPEPGTTIDRLVLATLTPGQKTRLHVDLDADCFGRPSDLALSEGRVSIAGAHTCVAKGVIVPLAALETPPANGEIAAIPASKQGTFGVAEKCEGSTPPPTPAGLSPSKLACIPGGTFIFGGPEFRGFEESSSTPARVAHMPRFWLDTHEVSVGRWRAAAGRGFVSPDPRSPVTNDHPFGTKLPQNDESLEEVRALCTYSTTPLSPSREDLPIQCVSWYAARAFCQFEGGDLPTEAEWEYAASSAARPSKTAYPWGGTETAPRCEQATFARSNELIRGGGHCYKPELFKPDPVTSPGRDDITPITGVVGLAGNVSEWLLDSAQPFGSACWRSSSVESPRCWEENALDRSIRGSSWLSIPDSLRPTFRTRQDAGKIVDVTVGLRCVYRTPAAQR